MSISSEKEDLVLPLLDELETTFNKCLFIISGNEQKENFRDQTKLVKEHIQTFVKTSKLIEKELILVKIKSSNEKSNYELQNEVEQLKKGIENKEKLINNANELLSKWDRILTEKNQDNLQLINEF
ncbi:mediator complex subunit 28 [Anaeramoeba flamelloides]|uniref:Mediator complex subunit 28 n=1 Tax=Anaeramoeba flamelloides TaxID=1746091 RepID=A0ABQ8XZ99_9EUKA|nr:mediator complex subunit 28 [Anaeramoeba flamelloides]